MTLPFNNDNSIQSNFNFYTSNLYDGFATSNYVISNVNLKQNTLTAATNLLGVGSAITSLDYNKITLNKPTNFQSDWNSTIINKPSYFPSDWGSTVANRPTYFPIDPSIYYNKTETNNLLSAKEEILTFNAPLTRTINTIGINLNSYPTYTNLNSCNYITNATNTLTNYPSYTVLNSCNYITNATNGLQNYYNTTQINNISNLNSNFTTQTSNTLNTTINTTSNTIFTNYNFLNSNTSNTTFINYSNLNRSTSNTLNTKIDITSNSLYISGNLTNYYNKTESDGRYLQLSGGNITGNLGLNVASPQVKLDIDGSILLRTAVGTSGGTAGIFFRNGFATGSYYNCSIMTYDHNADTFCDGISINGFDGVSICTGANTRQERMRVDVNGNVNIVNKLQIASVDINNWLFNNSGRNHGVYQDFNAIDKFGYSFIQNSTNGPGTGASQYYSWYIGLGNEYPFANSINGYYGMQFAIGRSETYPKLSVRRKEGNNAVWTAWEGLTAERAESLTSGDKTISGNLNITGSLSGAVNVSRRAQFTFTPTQILIGGLGLRYIFNINLNNYITGINSSVGGINRVFRITIWGESGDFGDSTNNVETMQFLIFMSFFGGINGGKRRIYQIINESNGSTISYSNAETVYYNGWNGTGGAAQKFCIIENIAGY